MDLSGPEGFRESLVSWLRKADTLWPSLADGHAGKRSRKKHRKKQGNAWTSGFSSDDQSAIPFLADKTHGSCIGSATQKPRALITLRLFRDLYLFCTYPPKIKRLKSTRKIVRCRVKIVYIGFPWNSQPEAGHKRWSTSPPWGPGSKPCYPHGTQSLLL